MGDAFPGPGGNQAQLTQPLVQGAVKCAFLKWPLSAFGETAQAHRLFPLSLYLASDRSEPVEEGPLAIGAPGPVLPACSHFILVTRKN